MPRSARTALLAVLMAMLLASAAIGDGAGIGAGGVIGCNTATAAGRNLSSAQPTFTNVGPAPFGVAAVPGFAFVANGSGTLKVLADHDSAPHVIHSINLPGPDGLGATVTSDRRYLLIASEGGAIVVDVARAEAGDNNAVLGTLDSSQGYGGAIEVTTSRDGRYAFVSLEGAGKIAVFRLAAAIADHFSKSAYVGAVPTGDAPVGLALSPDGRWLYSTSEVGGPRQAVGHGRRPLSGEDGSLSVIAVRTAERDPAHAVAATVSAGCQPVRVAVSPNGTDVWVTARGSDELLAFSAQKLLTNASDPMLTGERVGEAPVGVAVVDGGSRVVVADSNRFGARGATAGLTVVDSSAALAHRPAIVGTIRAQQFPRDVAIEPAGTVLLISNFGSGTLEAVHIGDRAQESRA